VGSVHEPTRVTNPEIRVAGRTLGGLNMPTGVRNIKVNPK